MKRTVYASLAVTMVFVSSAAAAQTAGKLYLEARGGVALVTDPAYREGIFEIDASFDPGFNLGGAVGYAHSSGLRGEVELSYLMADADSLTVVNDGGAGVALGIGSLNGLSVAADGDVTVMAALVNVFYDFNTGGPFKPFIGGGIGVANVSADISTLGVKLVDDDSTVFAYQVGAGLAYEIDSQWTVSLAYRYFATQDPEFTDTTGTSFDSEFQSHNILAGIRLSL